METNTIFHMDCLEGMKNIPSGSVDLIITDLPYGVTRNKWDSVLPLDQLWKQYKRIIKKNGAIILFGSGMFTADLMESNRAMWRYNLIYQKTSPTGFLNAKRMPMRCHEDICVFCKKLPTYNPQKTTGHIRKISTVKQRKIHTKTTNYGDYKFHSYDSTKRYPQSVLTFKRDTQTSSIHPTQKPVALIEYLIKTYSNESDLVLDSCMGSGTTAIAAINTNRQYIGFETDQDYYKKSMERIRDHIKRDVPKETV